MQRSVDALATTVFDVVVIGGGILGACVARDAALRGMSVALVDRGDWGGATSSNSLHIVHGGLRYLQHGDLRRMRESIRERSIWLRIAPHLIEPFPVLVPATGWGLRSRLAFAAAITLNEAVSWDRNHDVSADRTLPRSRMLSRTESLSLVPELASYDPAGGVLFYDGLMYSSERLVLETVLGAAQAGALVANYVEVEGPLRNQGRLTGVMARDRLAGRAAFNIRARFIINASGPGAARLSAAIVEPSSHHLPPIGYTLAINLGVDSTGHDVAFALRGRARELFVVPWRGRTLIGTAHLSYDGEPRAFDPARVNVDAFVAEVETAWPTRAWSLGEVRFVHAGLVPGCVDSLRGTVRPDRHRWLLDHAIHGEPSLLTVSTVKFTTARRVAEEVVSRVCAKMGMVAQCRTAGTPLPGAPEGSMAELAADARSRHSNVAPLVLEHLVRTYGRRYGEVIRRAGSDLTSLEPVVPGTDVVPAQFTHAARREMAETVDDIVLRRTELGAVGHDAPLARRLAEHALAARHAS